MKSINKNIYRRLKKIYAQFTGNKRKIYDAFIFYNELDLLELRLEELTDVVDYFVLVEATKTFRNNDKPLYFSENKERYKKFLNKIIHIVVDDMPEGIDPWLRENHQRNCIIRGLTDIRENDLVIISDVDEILNPEVVGIEGTLQQKWFYYYFNTQKKNKWTEIAPRCVRGEAILAGRSPQQIRDASNSPPYIKNGGWHFSFLGDDVFIANKIKEFSHLEYDSDEYTNTKNIRSKIESLDDVFSRDGEELIRVNIDNSFPEYLLNNLDKYSKFILK